MKKVNVKVIGQKGNVKPDPMAGTLLVESTYNVFSNIERVKVAIKNAIMTMASKIDDDANLSHLDDRVSDIVMGDVSEDSFFINDNFYVFTAFEE